MKMASQGSGSGPYRRGKKTSCMVGNFVPLVLLLASPVLSLGGGLVPKTSCMPGNLVLSVLREEKPVPPEAPVLTLLFESDINW